MKELFRIIFLMMSITMVCGQSIFAQNPLTNPLTKQKNKQDILINPSPLKKPLEKPKKKEEEQPQEDMMLPAVPEVTDSEPVTSNKPIPKLSQSSSPEPTGYVNGHEWVDLGLSVKWATCNIGAESPSDFGDYYAWGEKKTKDEYTMENSLTYRINSDSIAGIDVYDVAEAVWGSAWRLPTVDELNELISCCQFNWTYQGGQKGCNVTGPNGNSIFVPLAGWRCESELNEAGAKGVYWTSTTLENNPLFAYGLYFFDGYFYCYWINHRVGCPVRPVTE